MGFLALGAFTLLWLRHTILDILNFRNRPYSSLWHLQILLVSFPVILITFLEIERISTIYLGENGTEVPIALMVLGSLFLYILFLGIFLRVFVPITRKATPCLDDMDTSCKNLKKRFLKLGWGLSFVGVFIILTFKALGYHHATLEAFLTNSPLINLRLQNAYGTSVPSQSVPLLYYLGYILAWLAGILLRLRGQLTHAFLFGIFSLALVSMPGDKAPVLIAVAIFILSWRPWIRGRFSPIAVLIWGLILLIGLTAALFVLWQIQSPGLNPNAFFPYIFNRLGIGQMAGTYETFGMAARGDLPKGDFYWHMIPGASFFVDYIDYQKLLMMITEGYGYTEMGVKNTYFIAEAYAIGGYVLLWISPLIVALNLVLGIWILRKFFSIIFPLPFASELSILIYLISHNITGGFSSFPFFKGLIHVLILLGPPLLLIRFFFLVESPRPNPRPNHVGSGQKL